MSQAKAFLKRKLTELFSTPSDDNKTRFTLAVAYKRTVAQSVSPLARYFLLLRQKKVSKEKATPGRSESPAQNRASKAAG